MTNKQTEQQDLNLDVGTINFWIPSNLFQYNDQKSHILVNLSNIRGSIFIVKDDDNILKFFHVIIGKGRTDVEIDVSDLNSGDRHMITATWDTIAAKKINLYVDGGAKSSVSQVVYKI